MKKTLRLLALLLALSFLASCTQEAARSETTNSTVDSNDSGGDGSMEQPVTGENLETDSLYASFADPAANLSAKPLWFWNTSLDEMTTDQVREIVRESYLQSGYSGFGILPYWQDGYLSDQYFELYEAALDEGSKYGMEFSLYDENGFPSYTAGGLFAEQYPELTAKRLDMVESESVSDGKIFLRIPQGTFMGAVAYNQKTGELLDISDLAVLVDENEFDPDAQPIGVQASSTYGEADGYDIGKAFDGDRSTRWNAYQHSGGGSYITIAYENPIFLDEIRLYEDSNTELQRVKSFELLYYDESVGEWICAAEGTTITAEGAILTFSEIHTRFLRILFNSVQGDSATISEIELYDSGKQLSSPAVAVEESKEVGIYSSSDFSSDYTAEKAYDHNSSSRWNAKDGNQTDQWLAIGYAQEVTLDGVIVSEVFDRVTAYAIQYLEDGVWKDLVTGNQLGSDCQISFPAVTTTGIRLLMKSVKSDTASIAEFYATYQGVEVRAEENNENYTGSYLSYSVEGDGWKIMAFVTVKDGHIGMDYLSEEAVAGFIQITYEAYYARFQKYFENGTITSAFYDEPCFWPSNENYGVEGARMWTDDFNSFFAEMYGDDVNPVLYYPALFQDIGKTTTEARDRLLAVRTEMFAKRYIGQIDQWCRDHGIKLMGHMNCEDTESPVAYEGDLMYCFKYQEIPSVDVIYNYGMTEKYYKVISSSAYNWDKALVGVECYGAMGSDMPVEDLYKCAMDLYAKGINLMVPHAVWYESTRNVVFPPELSYRNSKYADELPAYNRYIARLSTLLQSGRHVADVAVLYPIDTLEAAYLFDGSYCIPDDSNYVDLTDRLSTTLRIDFTFLHPSVLDEKCEVQGSTLHLSNEINYEDYKVLILPSISTISLSNLQKIYEFYQNGGVVISVGSLPTQATVASENAAVVRLITEMFGNVSATSAGKLEITNGTGGKLFHVDTVKELDEVMAKATDLYDVNIGSVPAMRTGHLTYLHKVSTEGRNIYFFANSSSKKVETTVTVRGEFEVLELWDPMTGEKIQLTTTIENGYTSFTLSLDKISSAFVVEKKTVS
jgi:hypothetical protein